MSGLIEEVELSEEDRLETLLEEARALLRSIYLECFCENAWIRSIEAAQAEEELFVPRGSRQMVKVNSDDIADRLKQPHIAHMHELRERARTIFCSSRYGSVLRGGDYDSIETQMLKWLAAPED